MRPKMRMRHNKGMTKQAVRTNLLGQELCVTCGKPTTTPMIHTCNEKDIAIEAVRQIIAFGIARRWKATEITNRLVRHGLIALSDSSLVE